MSHFYRNIRRLVFVCCWFALLTTAQHALAVVSCSATATLPASAYDATTAITTTGSVTVTCTRAANDPSDPAVGYVRSGGGGTVSYTIGADGVNTGNTIAVSGANQLNYSLFRQQVLQRVGAKQM